MSSARRQPVVIEVTPDTLPTTPSSPSSPKAVRFGDSPNFSRPLTSTEAWSLYHFENHARQCQQCHNPSDVYRRGDRLCDAGHGLAQDVAYHVFHKEGEVYSTKKDDSKLVRVEIPHGYSQLKSLLRAMDRRVRTHKTVPIISYDRTYPVSARRSYDPEGEPEVVTIQPATSTDYRSKRRSTHKPVRYSTVVVDDQVEAVTAVREPPKDSLRRGSLYAKDMQRKKENYLVEIREPSERKERRREQRRSGVWS